MANFFDQFDATPDTAQAPPPVAAGGNFFDQFDAPAPAGQAPIQGADPNALQIRVGTRPAPADSAPASFSDLVAGDHSAPQRFASETGTDTALGRGLRAKADEALIGAPSAENSALTGLMSAGQAASLNAAGNAAAGVATVLGNLDKVGLPNVPGYGDGQRSFADNYRAFQDLIGAYTRQNPYSSAAGTVAGTVATAPLLPGLAGAPAASLGGRALQYGATGAGYGAAAELLDSKDPLKAAGAGALGFGTGAVLGPAIEKAAPAVYGAVSRALAPVAEHMGIRASAPASVGDFTPQQASALQAAGLDPLALPDPLANSLRTTFAAKGASPATIREAQAAEFGIPLSRAQTTGDPAAMALEQRAAAGASGQQAQAAATDFSGRQGEAVISARDWVNRLLAGDRAPITSPQVAGEGVADAARRIGDEYALRGATAQRQADQALEGLRGPGVPPDTLDAAALASQGIRDAAAQGKAAYRDAYAEMAKIPGTFAPGALDRMGSRVRDRIGAELPIDNELTPRAVRAIADLDAVPGIFNLQPGKGPNLMQVNQLRKRLVSYRNGTGDNATDRTVMDRILGEFDSHLQDAAEAGLFQHGAPAAPASPNSAAGGFQGMAAPVAAPSPFPAAGGASGKPESLIQYLGRRGGVLLDDDARAADLGRIQTGFGPLGRKAGRPIEDFRDELAAEGFIRPDTPDGMISRRIGNEVHDLIAQERAGSPVHRLADFSRGGPADVGGRIADDSAAYAERVAPYRQQVADDLAEAGYRPRDIDPGHLDDAAQRLYRGEHDTGADAYEAAVMGRDAGGVQPAPRSADAIPFDGPTAPAGAFPGSDTSAVDAMRTARGLFRDYKQAFAPRSPTDTAGKNLQRIIEQDATPNEVASMLFGGQTGRVTGRQLETLDRIKASVGADSDAWRAVQQATMGKYLEGRNVGQSLDYLLRGEGRDLAARVLTPEQRAGLDAFRTGTQQAERARAAVPSWVQDIAATGYDPNRVLGDLFGSGIPGARPGSAAYGRGLKQYLGADSPEWGNLRQAAWLKLTQSGESRPLSPRAEAERIRAFASGEGKGLAQTLFSKDELGLMHRYADAVAATDTVRGQRLPDGGKAAALAGHVFNVLSGVAAAKAFGILGPVVSYGARAGQKALQGGLSGAMAARSFNQGAPRVPLPLPAYAATAGRTGGLLGGAIGSGMIR